MSVLQPFRAYRPRRELAAHVASVPYDVVSSDEARELARGNPFSFLHVVKPEIDLDPGIPPHDERVYARARANLHRMIADGTLARDPVPSLYVYQQRMGEHVQAGVVGLCSVGEYESGAIRRHERTRPDKEQDRTRHVAECAADAEPVFLAYRARREIDRLVDEVRRRPPEADFTASDGVGHALWVVSVPAERDTLARAFAAVPRLYVADGHHRTAAAARHARAQRERDPGAAGERPWEFFLAALFAHDQVRILDYNRVVRDLHGLSPEAFLDRVRERFAVEPATAARPDAPRRFGMRLGGRWLRLTARPGTWPERDPVRRLDVAILQDNLLAPVLGIRDPCTDQRVDFVGGIRGTAELERRCAAGWALAFALHPTSLEDLMRVADAGEVMPPKSTWFEPKLRSGLAVHVFDPQD